MSLFEQELPPGLLYLNNWLSDLEHEAAVAAIDGLPFGEQLSRRTQHYGYFYDYNASEVNLANPAPSPPSELAQLAQRLADEGHFHRVPDQIIVNEYLTGQGISEHIDRNSFGPVVATVSLLESWGMVFRSPQEQKHEVLLHKTSLALMTGDSRSLWTHEIMKRQNDNVGGLKVPRGRRLSVTFRTVNQND
jgi:alkylated DNA repair dioxygenase AlkB